MTGEVRLRLEPGSLRRRPAGAATHSLYDYDLATYDADGRVPPRGLRGFVRLWGLGVETWARRQGPERDDRARSDRG